MVLSELKQVLLNRMHPRRTFPFPLHMPPHASVHPRHPQALTPTSRRLSAQPTLCYEEAFVKLSCTMRALERRAVRSFTKPTFAEHSLCARCWGCPDG